MALDKEGTRFVFYSGKGGVGKTSMASSTAVHYAASGKRVLLVTTDPAANIADVFKQEVGHKVTKIKDIENLWAMEIDPDRAAEEFREQIMAPMKKSMPDYILKVIEERFNSPCTAEIAAFDRFIDYLVEPDFDIVIFDTAPTGHTLRLLELPMDWSRHIDASSRGSGQTCMGPVEAIQQSKDKYDKAINFLRDGDLTTFAFVVQPEETSIIETSRSAEELRKIGINSQLLIINGILPPQGHLPPFFQRRKEMQDKYLKQIKKTFPIRQVKMYLMEEEIAGVKTLQKVGKRLFNQLEGKELNPWEEKVQEKKEEKAPEGHVWVQPQVQNKLSPHNEKSRIIFFTGKGGVGKTVLSCATALWSANQGHKTLLISTDPATHLKEVFQKEIGSEEAPVSGVENLYAASIDQKKALVEYKERILTEARQKHGEDMLAVIEEELDSPCTAEMAAFEKFVQYITRQDFEVIIFDTAPTGHTLRLLELPMDWEKQLDVMVGAKPGTGAHQESRDRFREVVRLLKDKDRTSFISVVYPENTPIVEAYRAAKDLEEAGIGLALVTANQVLLPQYCTTSFYKKRFYLQQKYLREMEKTFGVPVVVLPLFDQEIKDLGMLEKAGEILWNNEDKERRAISLTKPVAYS